MNEREFLKKLNSKVNEDGDLTPAIVEELLSEGHNLTVRGRIQRLRTFLFGNWGKSAGKIIEDNFETILDKTCDFQLNGLLRGLMKDWQTSELVKEKFDMVIKRFRPSQEGENLAAASLNFERLEFFRMCKENFTYGDDLIAKHIDAIIEGGVSIEELPELKLSEEINRKLNAKLESQKQEVARQMLNNIPFGEKSVAERQQLIVDYIPVITRIIEELLKDQNVEMVDIEPVRKGAYSKVYQIGDKVLKIGLPRGTYNIPNHPRILQPLTRTNLIDERDGNKPFACIEVSDRVDRLHGEDDLQVEKLYRVYKELRDDGIIWTDAKFANIGKLRRRNKPKLNGEEMNVDPVAVGMDKEAGGRALEAGDWVILDTDFIFRQEDSEILWTYGHYVHSQDFEKRWQQEKQGQIVAEYQKNEIVARGEHTKSYELRSWEKGKKKEEER